MIILLGGTCYGKDTIAKELQSNHFQYQRILELSTREQREGEKNGKDYWFNSTSNFLEKYKNGELAGVMKFERVENNEVHEVYYGTRVKDIMTCPNESVITTNAGAARKLKEFMQLHNKPVFVVLLSVKEEEQLRRLRLRGDEEAEIQKRMKTDKKALEDAMTFADIVVDNSYASPGCIATEIVYAYNKFISNGPSAEASVLS